MALRCNWFEIQLLRNSIDLRFNCFESQLIWDSIALKVNWFEIQLLWKLIDFERQLIWDSIGLGSIASTMYHRPSWLIVSIVIPMPLWNVWTERVMIAMTSVSKIWRSRPLKECSLIYWAQRWVTSSFKQCMDSLSCCCFPFTLRETTCLQSQPSFASHSAVPSFTPWIRRSVARQWCFTEVFQVVLGVANPVEIQSPFLSIFGPKNISVHDLKSWMLRLNRWPAFWLHSFWNHLRPALCNFRAARQMAINNLLLLPFWVV